MRQGEKAARGPRQGELFKPRGGKRKGAGRPKKGTRASERHETRPRLRASEPVHVVARVAPGIPSLRSRELYLAIRDATITVAKLDDFRIVHLSIQATHLHLIVEAQHRTALSRGMQAFQISAAKQVNRVLGERAGERRRGTVFSDRYHARILPSPRQVRNCVAYVLNNWRHHGEDRGRRSRTWLVDPFSSGVAFDGWKERAIEDGLAYKLFDVRSTYKALVVWLPRSWLLRVGWRRHGAISLFEVPGGKHAE